MLKRYPHIVRVNIKKVVSENADGLMGSNKSDETVRDIQGRVEINGSHNQGYQAKFFTDLEGVSLFKNDGITLQFEGRIFKIVRWQTKQSHLVLWLD